MMIPQVVRLSAYLKNRTEKYIKTSFWILMDQGIVSGVNFLTGVLLARRLGMYEFGVFTLAWSVVTFMKTLQSSLIITPMLSIGCKQAPEDAKSYYDSVFFQQVFYSVISCLSVLVLVFFNRLYAGVWLKPGFVISLVVMVLCVQFQDFIRSYFFSCSRVIAACLNDCLSYLLQLVVLILFMFRIVPYTGIEDVFWCISLTSLFAVGIGMLQFKTPGFAKQQFRSVSLRHWQFGSWFIIINLVVWIGSQGLLVLAGMALGAESIGGIKAAITLGTAINVIRLAVQNLFPVEASKILKERGHFGLVQYLRKCSIVYIASISLISLTIVVFRNGLMELLYGKEYLAYAKYVIYPAITFIIGSFEAILWYYFQAKENTKILVLPSIIATSLSVLLTGFLLRTALKESAVFIGLLADQILALTFLLYISQKNDLFSGENIEYNCSI